MAAIRAVVPDAELDWAGDALPFPAELEATGFDRDVAPFPRTTARRRRRRHDRALPGAAGLVAGRLTAPPPEALG